MHIGYLAQARRLSNANSEGRLGDDGREGEDDRAVVLLARKDASAQVNAERGQGADVRRRHCDGCRKIGLDQIRLGGEG